ncbi:unnamed protein product [Linum trigynum]|uniref:Polyprotein n=1 Tax=Linum trigynum TaxID=586398 RepID=A0AAV2CPN2_9ROSI
MEASKLDCVSVRFNGKNFALWELQFRLFVQGRRLSSILDGSKPEPDATASAQEREDWAVHNAQIMVWLLGSMDPSIALSLRGFSTAHAMWKHLSDIHSQVSSSRRFEIEIELARLHQGELDVRSYYQESVRLWTEHDLLTSSLLSSEASAEVLRERASSRFMQFFMKLRGEFEGIRSSLMHRNVTTLEDALGELVREETRLRSQAKLDLHQSEGSSAFAVSDSRTGQQASAADSSAFAVGEDRPKFHRTASGEIVCFFCKEPGHIQNRCPKRNVCNYCKASGHKIGDCPILAKRGRTRPSGSMTGGQPRGSGTGVPSGSAFATTVATPSSTATSGGSVNADLIRQLVQDAIKEALPAALGSVFTAGMPSRSSHSWHIDSAAFNHMTGSSSSFSSLCPTSPLMLQVADGTCLPAKGIGDIDHSRLSLKDTLYVPHLVPSLVSVGQLAEQGCKVVFDSRGCVVQDKNTGREIGRGTKVGRVFTLDSYYGSPAKGDGGASQRNPRGAGGDSVACDFDNFCYSVKLSNWDLWHRRLGHPHSARLLDMFKQNLLSGSSVCDSSDCVHCIQAKLSHQSFTASTTVYSDPFDLVHTDLWGPSPVTSRVGFRYFALFVDHATRFAWVYFLRHKSDLLKVAKEFLQMVKTQFGKMVKVIRSDPGGEFVSGPLQEVFKECGILPQQSCPGVSQQNGLVERKHRHVLELTRAILFQSSVPSTFWVEAIHTVVYLINRQLTPILDQRSPYEVLFGKRPAYKELRVFGCVCYVLLPSRERNKLTPKAVKCVFVGYSDKHKGYVCYDVSNRRIRISRDVAFLEHLSYYDHKDSVPRQDLDFLLALPSFPVEAAPAGPELDPPPSPPHDATSFQLELSSSSASGSSRQASSSSGDASSPVHSHNYTSPADSPSSSPDHHLEDVAEEPPLQLRRSDRPTRGKPPARMTDFVSFSTTHIPIPASYKQARGHPDWDAAMTTEVTALEANQTWEVVPRPLNVPVIGSKWVYNVKLNPDGSLERFKARVVAQGFRQNFGIDYEETFAPVAKMQTVRTLFAVAAMHGWCLKQLDVKNVFLHGDLKETIYMECPPGYLGGDKSKVCLLRRSLYGLKQAPRAWFEKFQDTILLAGFTQSNNDPSLFVRRTSRGITVLLIYVDDMLVSGDDLLGIQELTQVLHSAFKLKELGDVSYFLGLEVHRSPAGLLVSQQKYIVDLLETANMDECEPCATPMELNLKLRQSDGDLLPDGSSYRSLVGSLIYLTHTRPDISYAVQVVSQFMSAPHTTHMVAVCRILRYLRGTTDVGMFFPSSGDPVIEAYADADYAGCLDTRRSTSGWCVKLGHSFISWRCKKQERVSKSSTEAEYRSMSEVTSELVWLQRLVTELGLSCVLPMRLYADNTSAIRIALNPVLHDRTKHIEVHVHYIRQLVAEGVVALSYIASEDQTADLLTKAVATSRHWFLAYKLMLRKHHQIEGGC